MKVDKCHIFALPLSTDMDNVLMEDQLQVLAKRLRLARTMSKLSMDGLCERMGGLVTKQSISKYESGKMMPTGEVLSALARALDVDPEYFSRPFTFELDSFQVSFRKKASVGAREVSALKVQIQDEVERYLEIEQILGREQMKPQCRDTGILSTPGDMVACARQLRQDWGLGTGSIPNVQDLLESKGIKVIHTKTPEDFSGVSGIVNGLHYIIVLNLANPHVEHRRLTAFHELCHLLYNDKFAPSLAQQEKERLCHAFANEMLLPGEILSDMFRGRRKIALAELEAVDKEYGISIDAIIHKLDDIGIISDQRYRDIYIRRNQDKRLKDWMQDTRYEEKPVNRLEALVYSALARQLIPISKAAVLLKKTVAETEEDFCVL